MHRNKTQSISPFAKAVILLLAVPIISLISVLYAYIFGPLVIIASAIGHLYPRLDDVSLITFCKSMAKVTKFLEACLEAIGQCLIAMNFYSANKEYFQCPEPYFPWLDKGTVVIISMIFSIISITLAIINRVNESFTRSYGTDWWKLWNREDLLKKIWFELLLVICLILIFIAVLMYIIL